MTFWITWKFGNFLALAGCLWNLGKKELNECFMEKGSILMDNERKHIQARWLFQNFKVSEAIMLKVIPASFWTVWKTQNLPQVMLYIARVWLSVKLSRSSWQSLVKNNTLKESNWIKQNVQNFLCFLFQFCLDFSPPVCLSERGWQDLYMKPLYIVSVSRGKGKWVGFHTCTWMVFCQPCQRILKDGAGSSSHLVTWEGLLHMKIAASHILAAASAFPSKAAF